MKQKIAALILSFAMILSMATVAFAAAPSVPTVGTGMEQQDATVFVHKNLKIAEGITVPDSIFEFEITAITSDAPAATAAPISYKSTDTPGDAKGNGAAIYEIEKKSPIRFEAFPHAGVFEYKVKEKAGSYSGVDYSTEEYLLRVYVVNKQGSDGGVFVQSITAENNSKEKQEKVIFTNTYRKDSSLRILKKTTGTLADKAKKFDFTIQFTQSATSVDTGFVGTIGGTTKTFLLGQPIQFQLSNNQELVFENIPSGTRYVVTEIGVADGYTPKVTVIENGVQLKNKQGNEADDLNSLPENATGNLVGEGKNEVTFVNEYHEVPITGVILKNMPFVVLIGSAVLVFALLALLKRRGASKF